MPDLATISDEEAVGLLDQYDGASPERQGYIGTALRQYQTQSAAAEVDRSDSHFEKLFTDDDYFKQVSEQPQVQAAASVNPYPDAVKYRGANQAYLAHTLGVDPSTLNGAAYDAQRDGYAQHFLDKQGGITDEAFYQGVKKQQQQKIDTRKAVDEVPADIITARFEDMEKGVSRSPAEILTEWRNKFPDLKPSVGDESRMMAAAQTYAQNTDAFMQKYGEQTKAVFDTLKSFTQGNDAGIDNADLGDALSGKAKSSVDTLAEQLINVPAEDRQTIYGMAALYAKKQAGEDGDWTKAFENLSKSVDRTIGDVTQGLSGVERDRNVENEISEAMNIVTPSDGIISDGNIDLHNRKIAHNSDGSISTVRSMTVETDNGAVLLPTVINGKVVSEQEAIQYWRDTGENLGTFKSEKDADIYAEALHEQQASEYLAKGKLQALQIARELRQVANGSIDPITPVLNGWKGAIEQGVYSAAGSAPYLALSAIPVAGAPLTMAAYAGTEYDRIRLNYPNLPIGQAEGMAAVSGAVQGALDRLQIDTISGSLPITSRLFQSLSKPTPALWAPIAGKLALNAVEQNAQEFFQDLTPIAVDATAQALGADVPELDINEDLKLFAKARVDTFFALLPLVLVGGGLGTYVNQKRLNQEFFSNPEAMTQSGISQESAQDIASERNPERQATKFQAAWKDVPPTIKKSLIAQTDVANEAAVASQSSPDHSTRKVETLPDGTQEHVVLKPDGTEAWRGADEDAADRAQIDIDSNQGNVQQFVTSQLIQYFQGVNEKRGLTGVKFEEGGEQVTGQKFVDSLPDEDKPAAIEALRERLRIEAKINPSLRPENLLPPVPQGHVRFYHGGIKGEGGRDVSPDYNYARGYADKSKSGVVQYIDVPKDKLKESSDTEGTGMRPVYNWFHATDSQMESAKVVGEGDLASFVIDGQSETQFKDGIFTATNKIARGANPLVVVQEHVETEIQRALGEKRVTMDWLRQQVQAYEQTSGEALLTDSDQSVIEGVSTLAQAYVAGRLKDPQLPTGLRAYFRSMVQIFKHVFTRAAKLKKAIKQGKVGKDFEQFLAQSIGLDDDAQIAQVTNQELGKTFSIKPAEYSAKLDEVTGLPLNKDGTVTLYHGTTKASAEQIKQSGLLKSAVEPDIYLTTAKDGTGYGDGTVIAVNVDPSKLLIDDEFPDGRKDFRVTVGKSKQLPVTFSIKPETYSAKLDEALARLDTDPDLRREFIEKARGDLKTIFNDAKELSPAKEIDASATLEQIEQAKASELAELDSKEESEITDNLLDNRDDSGKQVNRKASSEKKKSIQQKYKFKREAVNTKAKSESDRVKRETELANREAQKSNSDKSVRAGTIQAMGILESFVRKLPSEARGRIGGFNELSKKTTDEARVKFLINRIEKVGEELERYLREDYRGRIEKLIDKSRPKMGDNRVQKSSLGPEAQRTADKVYAASLLDDTGTADRLLEIEAKMTAPDMDGEKAADLMEEWGIVNSFGDLANRNADSLATAHKWLEKNLKAGRSKWRIQEEARRAQNKESSNLILSGLKKATKRGIAAKDQSLGIVEFFKSFALSHQSLLQILDRVLPEEFSEVSKSWQRRIRRADNGTIDMAREAGDRLHEVFVTAVGSKSFLKIGEAVKQLKLVRDNIVQAYSGREYETTRIPVDLAEKIVRGDADAGKLTKEDIQSIRNELAAGRQKLADRDYDSMMEGNDNARITQGSKYVSIDRVTNAGELEFVPMSRDDALQYLLSWNQPDVRANMLREGWTEKSISQMEGMTSDEVSQYLLMFLKEEYEKGHPIINPIYQATFGMDAPQVQNYAPTRYKSSKESPDISPFGGPAENGVSSTPGFAKARVNHNAMMRQMGALTVYWQHIAQQAHWVNYAEINREMRAVLQAPKVRLAMEQAYGQPAMQQIDSWMDALATQGGNKANELLVDQKLLSALTSAKAVSALGLSLKTVLMQVDSSIRFTLALTSKQAVNALSDIPGLLRTIPVSWNSDSVQRRLVNGASPDARYLIDKARTSPTALLKGAEYSLLPMQYADAGLTSLSGAIVYKAAYDEAIEAGENETVAMDRAADAMDDAIYRYSQPTGLANKSLREVTGGSVQKLFMMFMSDPRLKTAVMAESIQGLVTGKGEAGTHIRRILAIEAMAMMSQILANAYRDAFSDDKDEDIWTAGGFAKAAFLAPLQGYFVLGSAADVAFSRLFKQPSFSSSQNPLEGAVNSVTSATKHINDIYDPENPDEMLKEWAAISRSAAIFGPASAVPAVIVNAVRPILGVYENAATDDE